MISILNYGVGNIKAFASVFTRLNVSFNIVNNKSDLIKSKKILFPGVGSFDNAPEAPMASPIIPNTPTGNESAEPASKH